MAAETALEWIEGGGLSFTVPAAMLDPSVPMSSVLSARTWQEQLSADERASLRRFLPDPTASEEDVRALLAGLFGDGDGDGARAATRTSTCTSATPPSECGGRFRRARGTRR